MVDRNTGVFLLQPNIFGVSLFDVYCSVFLHPDIVLTIAHHSVHNAQLA